MDIKTKRVRIMSTPNGEELLGNVDSGNMSIDEALITAAKDVMKESNEVIAKAKLIADEADKIRSK